MNCPRCDHPIEEHTIDGCQALTDQNDSDAEIESNECPCVLNEAQANRLAHRQKAGAKIREALAKIEFAKKMEFGVTAAIGFKDGYILALRDTGILAPGETEQDLLKELEGA